MLSRALSRIWKVSPTCLLAMLSLSAMTTVLGRWRTSTRTLSAMPRSVQRTYVTPLARALTSPADVSDATRSLTTRQVAVRRFWSTMRCPAASRTCTLRLVFDPTEPKRTRAGEKSNFAAH